MRLRCNFCNFPPQTFTTYSWESTDHQLPCLEHIRSPSTRKLSEGILYVTPLLDTGEDLRVTGSTYSDGICLHLFQLQQRTVRHALWQEVISDQNLENSGAPSFDRTLLQVSLAWPYYRNLDHSTRPYYHNLDQSTIERYHREKCGGVVNLVKTIVGYTSKPVFFLKAKLEDLKTPEPCSFELKNLYWPWTWATGSYPLRQRCAWIPNFLDM